MTHESEDAKVSAPEKDAAVQVDMGEDGLLWLINASVFHPRGFALALPRPDPGSLATVLREYARRAEVPGLDDHADALAASLLAWWAKPILQGDGREVWQFDMDNEPTPDQRFAAAEALFARIRQANTACEHGCADTQPYGFVVAAGCPVHDSTAPLDEDVRMHAMGPRHHHRDGRECAWHPRLEAWVTQHGQPAPEHLYVQCLRKHDVSRTDFGFSVEPGDQS